MGFGDPMVNCSMVNGSRVNHPGATCSTFQEARSFLEGQSLPAGGSSCGLAHVLPH